MSKSGGSSAAAMRRKRERISPGALRQSWKTRIMNSTLRQRTSA